MLGGGHRDRPCRPTHHVRDKNALRRPWLVEGIMDEAVKEEEHDQRPSSEEPQRVFPPH